MTNGDEYIYTGRMKSMEDIDGDLDKICYNFYGRVKNYFSNKVKPLFSKKESLDDSLK